ncbi:MAG: hypothetical protein ABI763_04310 [Bacteroidota bacterium]
MADQKNQNQGSQQPQTGNKNPQGHQTHSGQTGTSSSEYKKKEEVDQQTTDNTADRDRKGMRNEESGAVEDRNLKTSRTEEEESTDEQTSSRQSGRQVDTRR